MHRNRHRWRWAVWMREPAAGRGVLITQLLLTAIGCLLVTIVAASILVSCIRPKKTAIKDAR